MRPPTHILLLAASALAVVSVACSDDDAGRNSEGEITEAGEVSVFNLQPGDCIKPAEELPAEVSDLEAVPCEEPHTQEVFAAVQYESTDEDDDQFPGPSDLEAFANARCIEEFEPYVGIDYVDSELYFTYLMPTVRSWEENDDRTIVCLAVSTGEAETGSVRGSGR